MTLTLTLKLITAPNDRNRPIDRYLGIVPVIMSLVGFQSRDLWVITVTVHFDAVNSRPNQSSQVMQNIIALANKLKLVR